MDFGVFGAFLHEETEVRRQRLFREIRMSLKATGGVGSENVRRETLEADQAGPRSHLQLLAFVRVLHKLDGVYDELRHRSVLADLRNTNSFLRSVINDRTCSVNSESERGAKPAPKTKRLVIFLTAHQHFSSELHKKKKCFKLSQYFLPIEIKFGF